MTEQEIIANAPKNKNHYGLAKNETEGVYMNNDMGIVRYLPDIERIAELEKELSHYKQRDLQQKRLLSITRQG